MDEAKVVVEVDVVGDAEEGAEEAGVLLKPKTLLNPMETTARQKLAGVFHRPKPSPGSCPGGGQSRPR